MAEVSGIGAQRGGQGAEGAHAAREPHVENRKLAWAPPRRVVDRWPPAVRVERACPHAPPTPNRREPSAHRRLAASHFLRGLPYGVGPLVITLLGGRECRAEPGLTRALYSARRRQGGVLGLGGRGPLDADVARIGTGGLATDGAVRWTPAR